MIIDGWHRAGFPNSITISTSSQKSVHSSIQRYNLKLIQSFRGRVVDDRGVADHQTQGGLKNFLPFLKKNFFWGVENFFAFFTKKTFFTALFRECRKIPTYGTSYRVQCLSMSMLGMLVDVAYRSRQPISCGSRLILLSFDSPFQKLQNGIKISGKKDGQSINAWGIPLKNPNFIDFWLILSPFRSEKSAPDWK